MTNIDFSMFGTFHSINDIASFTFATINYFELFTILFVSNYICSSEGRTEQTVRLLQGLHVPGYLFTF